MPRVNVLTNRGPRSSFELCKCHAAWSVPSATKRTRHLHSQRVRSNERCSRRSPGAAEGNSDGVVCALLSKRGRCNSSWWDWDHQSFAPSRVPRWPSRHEAQRVTAQFSAIGVLSHRLHVPPSRSTPIQVMVSSYCSNLFIRRSLSATSSAASGGSDGCPPSNSISSRDVDNTRLSDAPEI